MYARARKINNMPRVVINAGIRSFVTKSPLTSPSKVAMISVEKTPPIPPIQGIKEEPSTATRASMDPIEISKFPVIIIKVIPIAAIAIYVEKPRVDSRFLQDANNGDWMAKNAITRTKIKGRPKLPHNIPALCFNLLFLSLSIETLV